MRLLSFNIMKGKLPQGLFSYFFGPPIFSLFFKFNSNFHNVSLKGAQKCTKYTFPKNKKIES